MGMGLATAVCLDESARLTTVTRTDVGDSQSKTSHASSTTGKKCRISKGPSAAALAKEFVRKPRCLGMVAVLKTYGSGSIGRPSIFLPLPMMTCVASTLQLRN